MKRRIAAVAVFYTICIPSIAAIRQPAPPDQNSTAEYRNGNGDRNSDNELPTSESQQYAKYQAASAKVTRDGDGNGDAKPDWWARIPNIVIALGTIALVIVGAIASYTAIKTLRILARQTAANKASADAALLNAQAVIKSERPWILFTEIAGVNLEPIETNQNRPTAVGINFANSGKTVARITAWKFGLFITDVGQVPPPSVFDTSGVNFKPTVIPKDVPLPHLAQLDGGRIITHEELRNITERHISHLWLCGILRYQDVFDPKNEHMTKICRRYHVWGVKPMFVPDGPAQYNDET